MQPGDSATGEDEPGHLFGILGQDAGVGFEHPGGRRSKRGSGASEVGGPAEVVAGQLHHAIAGPVAQRRSGRQPGCIRVRGVDIRLGGVEPAIERVRHPRQELPIEAVVGIEHHDRLLRSQRPPLQVPGQGRPLAVGPIVPFDNLGGADRRRRAIGASIGQHHHPGVLPWVVLRLEVGQQSADYCLLIVGGDDDPQSTSPGSAADGGLITKSPGGNRQVVTGQDDNECLGNEQEDA